MMVALAVIAASASAADYPRIANLWGCSPASTDYDRWARYDLLVLGGGDPEVVDRFARELRARNDDIVLLGTAPLSNAGAPEREPWMKPEWFLRRPGGEYVTWWADEIHTPNLLIDECFEALKTRVAELHGKSLDDGALDGVFFDSVVGSASWLGEVDTDRDGIADDPDAVDPKWLARQNEFFDSLRERWPGILIQANDVDFRHAPHLHGRLFEGARLLDRLSTGHAEPRSVIGILDRWSTESLQPAITFPIMTHPVGWQPWRVGKGKEVTTPGEIDRVRRDFRRMRARLLTCLMTDALYASDVGTVWYGSDLWYAEYDAPLGQALGPAREVAEVPPVTVFDWSAPGKTDVFGPSDLAHHTNRGMRLAPPEGNASWMMLLGTDPTRLTLEPGKRYRIRAECEVLEQPSATLQFHVRTGKGGWLHHDKGNVLRGADVEDAWSIDVTIEPGDFDDYAIEWHVLGSGALLVKSLKVELTGESYFIREFEGGVALVNNSAHDISITLDQPMRRLRDDEAPLWYAELDDADETFSTSGAWRIEQDLAHHYCPTCRVARKPGDRARWRIGVPFDDTYTVSACVRGSDGDTDSALYSLKGERAVIDQSDGDGGWVRLFEAKLRADRTYELELASGGSGVTVADAIRVESAARYNDGAMVTQVDMGPADGTILLRK